MTSATESFQSRCTQVATELHLRRLGAMRGGQRGFFGCVSEVLIHVGRCGVEVRQSLHPEGETSADVVVSDTGCGEYRGASRGETKGAKTRRRSLFCSVFHHFDQYII